MLFTDLSSGRAIKVFQKIGFWISRQGKHIGMTDGTRKITIPRHSKINPYTLRGIIRDAGLTDAEFKRIS